MRAPFKVATLSGLLLLCGMATTATADVIVYTGYLNNQSPFNPADVPTPFDPSATTTLVSSGDSSTSHDTGVIRFQNTGSASVTIGAVSVSTDAAAFQLWDSSLPFVLAAGANLVLAETDATTENFDSSDVGLGSNPVVQGSVNGAAFSFIDTSRILFGRDNAGGGAETTPYSAIGTITIGGDDGEAPEPGTLALLTGVLFGLRYLGRRR